MATLLGVPYSMSQMSYDLRRLRLKGLITRRPPTNTYICTVEGQRVAIFYTKLHTDSWDRCSPPTTHPHRYPCGKPYE